jgi:hypothetical protein
MKPGESLDTERVKMWSARQAAETACSLQRVLPTRSEKFEGIFFIVRAYSALNLVNSIVALFIAESPYRVAIGRVAIGGKQQTAYPAVAV